MDKLRREIVDKKIKNIFFGKDIISLFSEALENHEQKDHIINQLKNNTDELSKLIENYLSGLLDLIEKINDK